MGRPSKLTPERQRRLLDYISSGSHLETACKAVGIHYATFRRWIERGERTRSGTYREFCEALGQAEANMEATLIAQWRLQMPNNWQAIRDFLERRFPDRWGRKDRIDLSVIDRELERARKLFDLSDEETERLKALAVADAEAIVKGGKR